MENSKEDRTQGLKIEGESLQGLQRIRLRYATREEEDRIAALADKFEEMCRMAGEEITPDGRIGAGVAARLLGYSEKGFSNLRSREGGNAGPPFYRLNVGKAKVSYHIRDLAVWVESLRKE